MNTAPILPIRIPNPFFEGRNEVYVIRGEPLTLIDTGIATQIAYDRLVETLSAHRIRVQDIGRVILTHKHIDHIGNAWRIQQASGAEILIHEAEVRAVTDTDPSGDRFAELVSERLEVWQVPADRRPARDDPHRRRWEIEPAAAVGVTDGQRIDVGRGELQVIHTPGHTYGSICLRYGTALFTGDHVLAKTSPNVGGGDMQRSGLLQQFLASLDCLIELAPRIANVYPGHGDPFSHLAPRCRTLQRHHAQRCQKIRSALQQHGPSTVYEVAIRIFGALDDFHIVLGCAEAASHLEYLVDRGEVCEDQARFALCQSQAPCGSRDGQLPVEKGV